MSAALVKVTLYAAVEVQSKLAEGQHMAHLSRTSVRMLDVCKLAALLTLMEVANKRLLLAMRRAAGTGLMLELCPQTSPRRAAPLASIVQVTVLGIQC